MGTFHKLAYAGVSLIALATPAIAQNQAPTRSEEASASTEIVVTARRRSESAQDVPLVVNAVTSETLDKLNIRELKEITTVVPGLNLGSNQNGIGAVATLRGINYDVNASGNNGTVEFYLNDQPITANGVLQSMFDIGQIEVLRGPQGTLRGRASPSGSITVTTRNPDLDELGGYVNTTANTIGGRNVHGALNVPIIKGILALRVAGLFDNNHSNRVHSISNPDFDPRSRTRSERVTLRFDPTDSIDVVGTYQHFKSHGFVFDQVESANFVDPTQPPSPLTITPHDRLAVEDIARENRFKFDIFNLRAQWKFAGQKLNFVGAFGKTRWFTRQPNDAGNFFTNAYGGSTATLDPFATGFATTPSLQNAAQFTITREKRRSYELRLSSDQRLFGVVDYVVGGLINRGTAPIDLWSMTPVFYGPVAPGVPSAFLLSNFTQTPESRTLERSVFGNVTIHLGRSTEISGGLRYINYKNRSEKFTETLLPPFLVGNPAPLLLPKSPLDPRPEEVSNNLIYSASIKHNFTDDLMVYASTGSSWRASAQTNGIITGANGQNGFPWGTLANLLTLPSEKSKSYEVGFKSRWLDRKLLLNVTAYHQTFSNYFYSAPGIYIVQRSALGPGGSASGPNPGDAYGLYLPPGPIAIGVPVKVNGVEGEFGFTPNKHFNISGTVSYSLGKIKNGLIPCNTADTLKAVQGLITPAQLVAAYGGQQIALCPSNQRAGVSAPFSASLQSEYSHPISGRLEGFVRALASIYGDSQNVPSNAFDDVKSYALVNLFVGLRDPKGAWEVTGFVKNLFNVERVLSRDETASSTNTLNGPQTTTYRTSTQALGYTMAPPREFGINLRYSFGSR